MARLFVILHEESAVIPQIYETSDFLEVLKLLVGMGTTATEGGSSDKILSQKAFFDVDKTSMTSPLAGKTTLSDNEIVIRTIKKLNLDTFSSNSSDPLEFITSYTVEKAPYFIDVSWITKQGQSHHSNFSTLLYEWLNMNDFIALLKYAGVDIIKPVIEDKHEEEARAIAIETFRNIDKAIKELTTDFIESCERIMSVKRLENNNTSLRDYYRLQFEELEKQYNMNF